MLAQYLLNGSMKRGFNRRGVMIKSALEGFLLCKSSEMVKGRPSEWRAVNEPGGYVGGRLGRPR